MSTLKVGTIQNASGVEVYTCKAWVNFNGSGTVAIRASGNVSSITDNGTGIYTVNFTTAMPDANYAAVANAGRGGIGDTTQEASASTQFDPTTTSFGVTSSTSGGTIADREFISVAVFR